MSSTKIDRSYRFRSLDAVVRTAYKIAYRLWSTYLRVTRRRTKGAQVAVWADHKVLLVKSCYREQYTLPGGYLGRNETPDIGARRELKEETGLAPAPEQVRFWFKSDYTCGGRHCTDHVFLCVLPKEPEITISHREIVDAAFFDAAEVLGMPVDLNVRRQLQEYSNSPAAV